MGESDSAGSEQFPRTVKAALELLLSRLSPEMRLWLRRFKGDETELRVKLAAGLTPGMSVRAMLGLWGKNPELLAQLPPLYRHPDGASSYFLVECWRRLQEGSREPGQEVVVGQILAHGTDFRRFSIHLGTGEVITAVLPKSRKFGCLFGSLVGWNVKVVLRRPPKDARIIDLARPTQAGDGA